MVWKLFVLLLFWEITGAAVYWIYVIKFMMKLSKLDPNNDNLVYEMLETMSYGLFEAKKRDDESDAEHKKRLIGQTETMSGEPLLLMHLKSYFVWPKLMALVVQRTEEAYETMKSEYDRGIRTKKEGPVSQ